MFSWKPIYAEIAQKLLDFENQSEQLVQLLKTFADQGLVVSSLTDKIDSSGTEALLAEMDPFTFFGNFNRGITDANRKAILSAIKSAWSLKATLPEDFNGLPLLNLQQSWLMPHGFKRPVHHVPTLWKLYRSALTVNEYQLLDTVLFDQCLELNKVGLATLTMGMFWCRPDLWIALDAKNRKYVLKLGVNAIAKKGVEYIDWIAKIRDATDKTPCEISYEAHLQAIGPSELEFAEPFDRLFTDEDHANEVLDNFQQVLVALDGSEDDDLLACSAGATGMSGGYMSVIYGRWIVFRYTRKKNHAYYEILLPKDSPLSKSLEVTFEFKRSYKDTRYVLAKVDEERFHANPQDFLDEAKPALLAVKSLFKGWDLTPYAKFHIVGLIDLVLNPNSRADVLTAGLETSEHKADFWLLAPGKNAKFWEDWKEEKIGSMGWDEVGDLGQFKSKELIAEAVSEAYPEDGQKSVASMLWEFANEMKPGDIVFAKKGLFKVCGWGVVTGEYAYDDSREEHFHTLPIEWRGDNELTMPNGVQLALKTLTRVSTKRSFLRDMGKRFPGIPGLDNDSTVIDPVPPPPPPAPYTKTEGLNGLFMEEKELDKIMRLLRRKKNIVLQGAPGTGKTFIARRLAYLLLGTKDEARVPMVQFHQSTTYEDFIQGYRPNGDNGFNLQNGNFYEFVQQALASPESDFVFVIDEINRGNLSKVFGELMMLLESDKRKEEFALPLTYAAEDQDKFYIPENVYLIGTMNTADRSLSMVDYALRRRFAFVKLEPGFASPGFQEFLLGKGATQEIVNDIRNRMSQVNALITEDSVNLGGGYQIGHSFFVPTDKQIVSMEWLNEIIEFEILPLLEEYWCDDPAQLGKARQLAQGQT